MKKLKNLEVLFEANKKIFYRRLIKNRIRKYNYYIAEKQGKKICHIQIIHHDLFKQELNIFLARLDLDFNKFESEQFNKLENLGVI